MRISTITNWAYGVTVVLTALSGAAFIMSSRSSADERKAVEEHYTLAMIAEDLALGAEVRSDEARLYVMRGEDRHLKAFRAEEDRERQREAVASSLVSRGLPMTEAEVLRQIGVDAEALDKIEVAAIQAYEGADKVGAQAILFGPEHERLQQDLLTTVSHFKDLTATRTASQLEAARMSSDRWSLVAKIMLSLTATVFLAVLYFILRRRVAMPLMRMTGIVGRLAKQDYSVDVPADLRRDEIGEMNSAIEVFRANGLERERLDAERQADQRTKDLILQMLHRLQACQKPEELPDVVARFAPQVFPDAAGALYVLDGSKTTLMRASKWLEPKHTALSFLASACWGRRGRFHVSGTASGDVPCEHLHEPTVTALCVPLTAQGDMIGLLYLEELEGRAIELGRVQLYLELIAENLGLAIANLQMREKLTLLAIKDPLTGLYNRRFLDEALARFAADATVLSSMTCVMIDIDHFKRFNDQFGHDAGDMVMRSVAELLEQGVGAAGTVYRFGGEEFTILLPDGGEDRGLGLADMLRLSVQRLALSHSGKALGSVTISIGIASSAGSAATLIAHADASLLKAKTGGRNRVVVASNTGRFNIT